MKTGDLAVSNYTGPNIYGSISIFKHAAGYPTTFTDGPFIHAMYFLSYDGNGDIFVDGKSDRYFRLAKFHVSSGKFTNIYLNRAIYFPGGVQWEGKYVAVGDQLYGFSTTSGIDRVKVVGNHGTIVGSTIFHGAIDVVQFSIRGKEVIGPDAAGADSNIYSYPAGYVKKVVSGDTYPIGAVVSE